MSTKRTDPEPTGGVIRFGDIIEHDGHAWVLAHDDVEWFYECLKCNDWVRVLSIEEMNKAIEHNYAYMPLSHRAPWSEARPRRVVDSSGKVTLELPPPHPHCIAADAPVPTDVLLKRGPVVAVRR